MPLVYGVPPKTIGPYQYVFSPMPPGDIVVRSNPSLCGGIYFISSLYGDLVIYDGELFLDSRSYGQVDEGDLIELSEHGITIAGAIREREHMLEAQQQAVIANLSLRYLSIGSYFIHTDSHYGEVRRQRLGNILTSEYWVVEAGARVIEVRDGELYVDDVFHGYVNDGAAIAILPEGVFVCGRRRLPVAPEEHQK